ncbi:hypothetical protein GCM10020331_000780 [Ectobacillus funiculus]
MRISIQDFYSHLFRVFIYGIYELFIDDTYVYIKKIVGILSLIFIYVDTYLMYNI